MPRYRSVLNLILQFNHQFGVNIMLNITPVVQRPIFFEHFVRLRAFVRFNPICYNRAEVVEPTVLPIHPWSYTVNSRAHHDIPHP